MNCALHFGPEAIHVDMEGDFTFNDTRLFRKVMSSIRHNDNRSEVRLNLSNLSSMDCTAMRLFMLLHDMAKKQHVCVVFEGARGPVLLRLSEVAQHNLIRLAS